MARRPRMTPAGAIVRGVIAGALGTAAMDLFWYYRYRRGGGSGTPLQYEFGGKSDWDDVSAPGKIGKRVIEGLTRRELPDRYARVTNTAVHWGYGMFWGSLYGVLAGSLRRSSALLGLPFAVVVWYSAYALLPPTGLYKPVWEYDARTLLRDLGAHLAYGSGVGLSFKAMRKR